MDQNNKRLNKGKFKGWKLKETPGWYQSWLLQQLNYKSWFEDENKQVGVEEPIVTLLCNLTENYTLDDWRVIQTEEYFAEKATLKYDNEIHEFILKKIREYERQRSR